MQLTLMPIMCFCSLSGALCEYNITDDAHSTDVMRFETDTHLEVTSSTESPTTVRTIQNKYKCTIMCFIKMQLYLFKLAVYYVFTYEEKCRRFVYLVKIVHS